MKIEYFVEDKTKKLSQDDHSAVVSQVVKNYENWNDARSLQLEDAQTIRECIYQRNARNKSDWKSQMKLPDIYELAQTLKAHIWENIYSNPEGMFDVSGKTPDAQAFAPRQKAMLVNAFNEMKVSYELDKAVDDLIEVGDCVLFVGWETRTKQVRRVESRKAALNGTAITELNVQGQSLKGFTIENKVCFEGVKIKSIRPEDFVFDISKKENWDSCPKIYRTFSTIQDIEANKVYKLSKDSKEALSSLVNNSEKYQNDVNSESISGDQVEILEYWGDFKLADGTVLRNWLITVAGRSEIIRFEGNPYVINPFICSSLIEDPTTKRGISPLRVALVLNDVSSDILNRQLDALSLVTNPPYLAPKGCFNGAQEVSPGKIIEYESSLMPQIPTPLRFESALQGWEFIKFFKGTTESSTGIFKNMVGNVDASKRTATEINYTVGGQSTRLNMTIDCINQKVIVPMVERVADMLANFRFGVESVSLIDRGRVLYVEIDDSVRQADYKYIYADRKATQERKYKFKELFEVVTSFAKVDAVAQNIDWIECFKYALEQYGIENSEQLLLTSDRVAKPL